MFLQLRKFLIAVFSFIPTLLFLALPWKLRSLFGFFLAKLSFWFIKRSDAVFNFVLEAKSAGKERRSSSVRLEKKSEHGGRKIQEDKHLKKDVVVLFSGGSDSTLTAVRMLKEFEKVYLLTYRHSAISGVSDARAGAERLQERFGSERVFHEIVDIDNLLNEVYNESYFRDLRKYGTFQINACIACKLAMYIATVAWCLGRGIKFVASGANKDASDLIADQMEPVSRLIRSLFDRYGITYMTPVYSVDRTDWELFELGIANRRDAKPRVTRQQTIGQAFCEHGFLLTMYAKCYYVPLYGQRSFEEKSFNCFKEKMVAYEGVVKSLRDLA